MTSDLDITDSVLAELRSAADIVEVVSEHTSLKKAGRSWKGLCPFHKERTPSFTVDRDKGLYHCFGCGAGGDVIHFVRQIDRLDFPEAVEALAGRFGVTIPRRVRSPRDDRREKLHEAVAAAQRFYAERLWRFGSRAAEYLRQRAVPENLWRRLGLGHAPEGWDTLSRALLPAFPESLLVEAGLLQPRQEGKGAYDRFRDRLLFVLKDDRGRPVGFGGRALPPEGEPKYLNSPESPLFQKKRMLYGLSDARDAIRRRERAVLVEGYFDHLALLSAGVEETVASMGTALTPDQAHKLRRLSQCVVVCYDGDAAGRAATVSALLHLVGAGSDARVARLPDGMDPHDVLRAQGVSFLSALIEEAPDYLDWLIWVFPPDEAGLTESQKKQRLEEILSILSVAPDPAIREAGVQRLARRFGLLPDGLWQGVEKVRGGQEKPPAGTSRNSGVLSNAGKPEAGGIPEAERALLSLLVRGVEFIPLILRTLKDDWLTIGSVKKVVAAFRRAASSSGPIDFHQQIAHLREENDVQLLARAAVEESPEPSPKRVEQILHALEEGYLARRGRALQEEIARAEAGKRPRDEVDGLLRNKMDIGRRIAELRSSRKGRDVGH